ncbi:MAG: hypothetical protein VYA34_02645 [Myxococcota bacterium]|nr:hypothetical protein [Myxococcota bacterium]
MMTAAPHLNVFLSQTVKPQGKRLVSIYYSFMAKTEGAMLSISSVLLAVMSVVSVVFLLYRGADFKLMIMPLLAGIVFGYFGVLRRPKPLPMVELVEGQDGRLWVYVEKRWYSISWANLGRCKRRFSLVRRYRTFLLEIMRPDSVPSVFMVGGARRHFKRLCLLRDDWRREQGLPALDDNSLFETQ